MTLGKLASTRHPIRILYDLPNLSSVLFSLDMDVKNVMLSSQGDTTKERLDVLF